MAKENTYWLDNLKVRLVEADAAVVPCDAIVTAVNCDGTWSGGVNRSINRVAGADFHRRAREYPVRSDGDSVIFRRERMHGGGFRDVIVMYDNLTLPLGDLVKLTLDTADYAGLKIVCLPALRTGSRLGYVEQDVSAVVVELVSALRSFAKGHRAVLQEITVPVLNNKEVFDTLAYDLERAQY